MKLQTIAQFDVPDQAGTIDLMTRSHLRVRLILIIESVKRIENKLRVDIGDEHRTEHRIQNRQIRMRNPAKQFGRRRGVYFKRGGQTQYRGSG